MGNILECLRADFHRQLLEWTNQHGGIYRLKFLWQDALVVTDPVALAAIMGRGEGAMDKAALVYAPINKMCDPHGNPNLLTSKADDTWKAIRKAVAVSFSMQVRGQAAWHVQGSHSAGCFSKGVLQLGPWQLVNCMLSGYDQEPTAMAC